MSLLVLHDFGPGHHGQPWADALGAAPMSVLAPDLPGHGGSPPPIGGNHDLMDPAFQIMRLAAGHPDRYDPPDGFAAAVGVGVHGWSAQSLVLAGRARRLVLVDGLGGPFLDAADRMQVRHDHIRRLAEQQPISAATRLDIGLFGGDDLEHAQEAAAATAVPTLLIHTAESTIDRPTFEGLADRFADATVREASDRTPAAVAPIVLDWLAG
ncbi:MAG: hypothetical protein HKN26_15375 [Acidimicrobiales bacterium]|nr:hypothetical protein [Acidimicrobiales bacterium]